MPPWGYLTSQGIEEAVEHLNDSFPSFTDRFRLAEQSIRGASIHGIRIRTGTDKRNGVLLVGGTHACELINPDLLLWLAYRICFAYADGTGLTFHDPLDILDPTPEGKRYSDVEVKMLVDGLDLFIVPNVNPDGRQFVLDNYQTQWAYRRNRRLNAGGTYGVDLNRNFDFVWEDAIGSSDTPGATTYHGTEPFSEPESRNVRVLLDAFPQIVGLADVHSYHPGILHPWGDAPNQSTDTSMNFQNAAWDGQRENSGYGEYIPAADEATYVERGERVRSAIAAMRGRDYEVGQPEPIIGYDTSGTTRDYAYSRYFLGPNTKIWAYTIETNRRGSICPDSERGCKEKNDRYGLSPPYLDAYRVMVEVGGGLVDFMLSFLCVVRDVGSAVLAPNVLDELSDFRSLMLTRLRGRAWAELLDHHNAELLSLLTADRRLRKEAEEVLEEASKVVVGRREDRAPIVTEALAKRLDRIADRVAKQASPRLREAIESVRKDLRAVVGKSADEAIGEELGATR